MDLSLRAENLAVTLRDSERTFTLRIEALGVAPGEAVGLTGASGTGKTLLLELLGLLRQPDHGGRYLVADGDRSRDLAQLWLAPDGRAQVTRARGTLFGFVPQSGGLMPFLSVAENVALSQRIADRPDPEFAASLIAQLGLKPVARLMPAKLSIGQRQRVSIARALAHRPRFVIADEPTAALDPETAAAAMALLIGAAEATGTSVIISSHDLSLLDRFPLTRYALTAESTEGDPHVVSNLHRHAEVPA
ncbi:MAG: ATP-binding cassette domain-containing protein [Rhodobacteraceae bacterium]|nr:ATP-binding cassette domain-containing protein [Paracoccaceae bacterium]